MFDIRHPLLCLLMIARVLLALYQARVLFIALCLLTSSYPELGLLGLVWVGILCGVQVAITRFAVLITPEDEL